MIVATAYTAFTIGVVGYGVHRSMTYYRKSLPGVLIADVVHAFIQGGLTMAIWAMAFKGAQ